MFQQDASYAVTRAEFLDALFTTGLSYKNIEKPPLPKDVPRTHRFAGTIGSSLKYGLIPAEGNFMPDEAIDGREAVRLALMMMGFGFEASLCESFASMGLEGDAIYSLAYGMKPPAPKRLIKGWTEPLDEKGRNSILSWTRSCKERVIWKKELQKDGINLMLYRQGTGLPESRAGLTGEFAGISAKRPVYIAAVIASQDEIDMTIAFAGTRNGKADLSLIARKENASAAVNGGFFAGRHPAGAVLLDGVHAGKPVKGRPAVAWAQNNGAPIFGDGSVRVGIRAKSGYVPVTRFNSPPPADGAAIYASRVTGEASGIAPDSLVIKTRDGSVIRTWEASELGVDSFRIPPESEAVIARGRASEILSELEPGATLVLISDWIFPAFAGKDYLSQAGPMLISGGVPEDFRDWQGKYSAWFLKKRHPRTIMGTDGKRVFWAVIDGRDPARSLGATMEETREIAGALGLSDAINMDGGGSSQLIWQGLTVNRPSEGKERPLPYGLIMKLKSGRREG
ncbi:MAG: phosphodiester glycosidase family protein [Synergistaceae bacterium]|nr:phosphodiester glycosidase family protein [Synergistaceae bacterium]